MYLLSNASQCNHRVVHVPPCPRSRESSRYFIQFYAIVSRTIAYIIISLVIVSPLEYEL